MILEIIRKRYVVRLFMFAIGTHTVARLAIHGSPFHAEEINIFVTCLTKLGSTFMGRIESRTQSCDSPACPGSFGEACVEIGSSNWLC